MSDVRIRPFQPGDEAAFRQLNEEWIGRYFRIEEKDREILDNPYGEILDPGGAIRMAEGDDGPAGCCALVVAGPGLFELAKMTVAEQYRGRGLGKELLAAAIAAARSMGASRLFLETNSKLAPALRLYESAGFVRAARVHESEYARADVYMEMTL